MTGLRSLEDEESKIRLYNEGPSRHSFVRGFRQLFQERQHVRQQAGRVGKVAALQQPGTNFIDALEVAGRQRGNGRGTGMQRAPARPDGGQ
jgi:hypothetical protein